MKNPDYDKTFLRATDYDVTLKRLEDINESNPDAIIFVEEGGKESLIEHNKKFDFVPSGGEEGLFLSITTDGLGWDSPYDSYARMQIEQLNSKKVDKTTIYTKDEVYNKEEIQELLYNDPSKGYEFVDFGLPSGLLWATRNLGAKLETDYGLYFAWGETQGYNYDNVKPNGGFIWDTYKFGGTSVNDTQTKYNSSDGKTVLDLEDDAAHVLLGDGFRIPTKEDFYELKNNTTNEWVYEYNGIRRYGMLFTGKGEYSNVKLFLPANGYSELTYVNDNGEDACYYTSTLDTSNNYKAQAFDTWSNNRSSFRCDGYGIRCVATKYTPKSEKYLTEEKANNLYEQKLPKGEIGQVLTQEENGVSWKDNDVYTKEQVDNKINEELYVEGLDTNGYDYVDMGEAGIWATCNVGANSPEEYGLYFAWGETTGYTKEQIDRGEHTFNFDTYKFGTKDNLIKYNNTDGLTTLELEDDAAHVLMGGGWRIPTKDEFIKLNDLCNHQWINNYNNTGINGELFTLKTDESKQLFFPACGIYGSDGAEDINYVANNWSSQVNNSNHQALGLEINHGYVNPESIWSRHVGQCVRGIVFPTKSSKYLTKKEAEETYAKKEDIINCECEELTEEDIDDIFKMELEEGWYCIKDKEFNIYTNFSGEIKTIHTLSNPIIRVHGIHNEKYYVSLLGVQRDDPSWDGKIYYWDSNENKAEYWTDDNNNGRPYSLTIKDIFEYLEELGYSIDNLEPTNELTDENGLYTPIDTIVNNLKFI